MKHLDGRLESQSFTRPVMQPAFDHSISVVSEDLYSPRLGFLPRRQSVAVLVGATLPTCQGAGEPRQAAHCHTNALNRAQWPESSHGLGRADAPCLLSEDLNVH